MFKIEYKINSTSLEDLNVITEENIRYNFLQGSVYFYTEDGRLEMEWEWIPLLDFSFCLSNITTALMHKDEAKEYFEFTESAETIEFFKKGGLLKIIPSFSDDVLNTSFDNFSRETKVFHSNISKYIKESVFREVPSILNKYISVDD